MLADSLENVQSEALQPPEPSREVGDGRRLVVLLSTMRLGEVFGRTIGSRGVGGLAIFAGSKRGKRKIFMDLSLWWEILKALGIVVGTGDV